MTKGDIILITFPFTDLTSAKLRPAVILAESSAGITACFITTQLHWQEPIDLLLHPSDENGLKKTSLIRTGKIATLSIELAKGLLGKLSAIEVANLNNQLKTFLQLT